MAISFMDRTFCASPNCKNDCGRQMTHEQEVRAEKSGLPVAFGYFCGEPTADGEAK